MCVACNWINGNKNWYNVIIYACGVLIIYTSLYNLSIHKHKAKYHTVSLTHSLTHSSLHLKNYKMYEPLEKLVFP